mmetsp:Transcript_50919/g.95262  ORF Transcript_50919/g.95262 Transcript_50919/m.95262 type:complete len:307 (+) Transcript_50919:213-1133(+)
MTPEHRTFLKMFWMPQREEHGEPAEHAHRQCAWMNGDARRPIQHAVKIAGESVYCRIYLDVELHLTGAIIALEVPIRMFEFETILDAVAGVESMVQVHHVGSLQVSETSTGRTSLSISPEAGRGNGRYCSNIALRNAHAICCQESLRAVDALRTQLIVSKRPKQFTHDGICFSRSVPASHVTGHYLHRSPFIPSLAMTQRMDSVRVLLDCKKLHLHLCSLRCLDSSFNKRTAPSPKHHYANGRLFSLKQAVTQEEINGLLVLCILHRIPLKEFVGFRLQVVGQWLKRSLQRILMGMGKTLSLRERR